MKPLVRVLRALSCPHRDGHIYGDDGSLYMERFEIFGIRNARLQHIVREDRDRHLHDHPWPFVSKVLSGAYREERPLYETPHFIGDVETTYPTYRATGSWAFRRAHDRHKISHVEPDTWTLFITGRYCNKWGFFTPEGKIYWRTYLGLA